MNRSGACPLTRRAACASRMGLGSAEPRIAPLDAMGTNDAVAGPSVQTELMDG